MAKNKLAIQLRHAKSTGIDLGLTAMCYVTLVAADNVLKDYMEDEQLSQVLKELEAEMDRVWCETASGRDADEAAELLVWHSMRIREKRGMDA